MRKYGWYAHTLIADPQTATGLNYHTHGFLESLGHLDLQLVFPAITDRDRHAIAAAIYDQIKKGRAFQDGDTTEIASVQGKFRVRFIKVREGKREVLRVILPTSSGELEPKDLSSEDDPFYSLQWTVTKV